MSPFLVPSGVIGCDSDMSKLEGFLGDDMMDGEVGSCLSRWGDSSLGVNSFDMVVVLLVAFCFCLSGDAISPVGLAMLFPSDLRLCIKAVMGVTSSEDSLGRTIVLCVCEVSVCFYVDSSVWIKMLPTR